MLGRIGEDALVPALLRYYEMDMGETDPNWFALGFAEATTLSVQVHVREIAPDGSLSSWRIAEITRYEGLPLRAAHEEVLSATRPRDGRTKAAMACEASALILHWLTGETTTETPTGKVITCSSVKKEVA